MTIIETLRAASPTFTAAYDEIAATTPGTNAERIVHVRGVHAQIMWISDSSDPTEDRLEVLLSPASQKRCDLSFIVRVDPLGDQEETVQVGSGHPATVDRILDLSDFRNGGSSPVRKLADVLPFDVSKMPGLVQPLMQRQVKAWDLTTGDYYAIEFDLLADQVPQLAKAA
ncbi:hypothetical protein [uncultured Salinicola sp.]|uniref:hypothetical protein n=1 Tax=uncultured Salinicola sp. TaxID=1193542 RepID=UPI0026393387|nr:hypothetical protein [uncultured Salinicola sp.]|tara:strand:+ start:194 stop:703 length:510 start_codon:yes stop_codon:yes gene_type:complete